MLALEAAGFVLALHFIGYQVLGDDDFAFGADHFGDLGDAARAVAHAFSLNDDVDRAHDHFADGPHRQREAAHGDHGFQAAHGFARAVGVQGAHRAVMAGVHRLQQVEGLGSAHFAHDDAFGTHAQAVAHQVAHGDLALAFQVGRAGFQPHHMGLLQLEFGGVFAGDDALFGVDIGGHAVQQGGLARTGTARDQDVAAAAADHLQHPGGFRTDGAEFDQVVQGQLVFLELANGQGGAVQAQRRADDVDAGAVQQAGVADGRRLIHAPADLADDALADVHQLGIVAEADIGELYLALDFDEDPVGAIDHDVGDVVARQQRLQRSEER